MNDILQAIVIGLPQGALYSLMGFGISMIFRSAGTLNFSHGYSAMLCVLITLSIYSIIENLLVSIVIGMLAGALVGFLIDLLLMRPIKHISTAGMLMITLGLLLVFEGSAIMIWGADFQRFPALLEGGPLVLESATLRVIIRKNDIIVFLVALIVSITLALFMKRTKIGLAIQARGQDKIGAQAVGINVNLVDSVVWALSISLAVLVGVLIAPRTYVHPTMLLNIQLFGITAAVVGGFGNLFGAIWGGLIIGILQRIIGIYIDPGYQMTVIFLLIILVLVFKPEGIFGRALGRKA